MKTIFSPSSAFSLLLLLVASSAWSFPTKTMTSRSPDLALRVASDQTTIQDDEQAFKEHTKQLCQDRNLPLQKVKNARDLASVANSPVKPGRLFRMGRISDATPQDVDLLMKQLDLHTIVDLRSPTELKDDPTLLRKEVFDSFTDIVWKESKRNKDGCVQELQQGEFPVIKPFWSRKKKFAAEEYCDLDCTDPESMPASKMSYQNRRERHFVSLMNEMKYVKGTVSHMRKRDLTKALLKSPGALVSRRVRGSVKEPFLDKINAGGLPMLNELLLRYGAPGIKYVLELCADRNRHPIAFYCTAGKDRTGMIAAIILGLCGVKADDIVEDYSLSANVYAEMNDHQAMVGALSQRNLDAKTFLGAPPRVMKDTLQAIDNEYGSIEGYCNWIGFGPEKQEALRKACMDE